MAKLSKSNTDRTLWEFRIVPAGPASFVVEFKYPWCRGFHPTTSWSTEAAAQAAVKVYQRLNNAELEP